MKGVSDKSQVEADAISEWRGERFYNALKGAGLTDDQITVTILETLVNSNVSPHDLEGLIEKGCDPETAIRILV